MSEQPSSNELSLLPLRVMAAKERGEISADLARDILEGLSHETTASPQTDDAFATWKADGSKDWWSPTWARRTAISYAEKAETFVPLTLLTEALGLLQRARYFTPEADPPALTHEINNFLGTFDIAPAGYSPRASEKAGERCCCGEYTFWPSTDATMAQVGTTVHRKSGPCYQLPPLNGTAD